MIAFVTLFLGLAVGIQPIEVSVTGPVARVEILLDGVKVAESSAPPWKSKVDFGSALKPHLLVARTLDSAGQEISSTSQWINLPRPRAEAEIVLENGPDGRPATARLNWQSFDNSPPTEVSLHLDGLPLPLDGNRRAALPKLDLGQAHVLSAELRFGNEVTSRRDRVFGGGYGSELETELTAVPLRLPAKGGSGGSALSPAALAGRIVQKGEPLAVAAVEEGPAKVMVVSATPPVKFHDRYFYDLYATRNELRFAADVQVCLVAPGARRVGGPVLSAELFDTTHDFTREDGGLPYLMAVTASELWGGSAERRIRDAVAVAGLLASAENRRRAVVLVLSDDRKKSASDTSRFSAKQVRSYLAELGVPLHVWSPLGGRTDPEWGPVEDVSSLVRLRKAFDHLNDDLESQRIALVEGRHFLRDVQLTPGEPAVQSLGGALGGAR